MFLKNYFN